MKKIVFIVIFVCLAFPTLAIRVYTMSVKEFAEQFNDSCTLKNVYCHNKDGQKVWLHCNSNTILTLSMSSGKKEQLILQSIKLKGDKIEAMKFNVWGPAIKISAFHFADINRISIPCKSQEFEQIYYNKDSVSDIAKQKNDSLKQIYSSGYENSILLSKPHNKNRDTIRIREHACYHLTFNNGRTTEFGVVQKITIDSICISNFFNKEMALKNKAQYELYHYPVTAIQKLSLLRSGGYSFNTLEINEWALSIINESKIAAGPPYWFAVNPTTGELKLYRLWQTDKGYAGITETKGNPIWYEGEATQ